MQQYTYQDIQAVAEAYAQQLRTQENFPALPTQADLEPYQKLLQQEYQQVFAAAKAYTDQFDPEGGHGFEHLTWVSALAGWIAARECDELSIVGQKKTDLVAAAVLAGFLHDIDRHLGRGAIHMQQGALTAQKILAAAGLVLPKVVTVIAHHDEIDFDPGDDQELALIFGAVFDADHFRYGLEREDTFWQMKQLQGVLPAAVLNDYQYLLPYRTAWRSSYGKQVGPSLIDFGVAIAQHVEATFGD